MSLVSSSLTPPSSKTLSDKLLKVSVYLITTTVWISALLFGLYILAFYAAALYEGNMDRWNTVLPKLYEQNTRTANSGIGLHFAAGGVILVLGCIQLMDGMRNRYPALHRWSGRIYLVSCLLAAVGGLIFILVKGTIGGTVMNLGFGLYGVLMFIAAVETYRHAVAGRLEKHRVWGLRLFALAIGSWLYRMDYGFWLLFKGGGHNSGFTGGFDQFMSFFFYLPNLLVVELFLRAKSYQASGLLKSLAAFVLLLATAFLLTGTYFFTKYYWGPAIIEFF